ncbi:MAG: FAD:protein FMN transferase [Clostridia bacterium]|nr:FAD:protein FMN transferase [Clostridia bacterium]
MKQRRPVCFLLLLCLLSFVLSGCQASPAPSAAPQPTATPAPEVTRLPQAADTAVGPTRYSRRAFDIFDTEILLMGYADSQEDFNRVADATLAQLQEYNQIFDGYNAYGDLHNLWYVNEHAAEAPVEVPEVFFELLTWCRDQWNAGHRQTNIAMGAVLKIWHDYRTAGLADPENAQLPPMDALQSAFEHTGFEHLVLDEDKRTVYFADPQLRLDLGAVAKGYAADLVLPDLMEAMPSFLLSLGGNVYAGNAPLDGRANWNVGVQDPKADPVQVALGGTDILDVLEVHDLTVVTSGDYWRYYLVDGEKYHHIIDPETLMPSKKMISVTIVCKSSLLADYLSTTLFILSYEDGLKLIEQLDGVEAMWVEPDGAIHFTPGMNQYSRMVRSTPS